MLIGQNGWDPCGFIFPDPEIGIQPSEDVLQVSKSLNTTAYVRSQTVSFINKPDKVLGVVRNFLIVFVAIL